MCCSQFHASMFQFSQKQIQFILKWNCECFMDFPWFSWFTLLLFSICLSSTRFEIWFWNNSLWLGESFVWAACYVRVVAQNCHWKGEINSAQSNHWMWHESKLTVKGMWKSDGGESGSGKCQSRLELQVKNAVWPLLSVTIGQKYFQM